MFLAFSFLFFLVQPYKFVFLHLYQMAATRFVESRLPMTKRQSQKRIEIDFSCDGTPYKNPRCSQRVNRKLFYDSGIILNHT